MDTRGPAHVADAWASALVRAEQPYLIDAADGSVFTVGELDLLSRRAVSALSALGFGPGDRAILVARPEVETLLTVLGALRLGVTLALLPPQAPPTHAEELARLWEGARTLELDAALGEALARLEPAPPPAPVDPDQDAVVLFSSGSTGPARGVRLSWRALAGGLGRLAQIEAESEAARVATGLLRAGAREGCAALPHTVTGYRLLLAPLYRGTTTVLLPPGAGAAELLDLAATHALDLLHAGPGFARACLRAPERHAALVGPSLRAVALGGGAIEAGDRQRLADALGVAVIHTYGLTESAGLVAAAIATPGGLAPVGMGRPMVPVRVLDEAGRETTGEGRIEVAPPTAASGYLGGGALFSDAARRWVRTGDLGWLDAAGRLHVRGRAARLLTLPSGEKVQLEDVEQVIRAALGLEVVVVAVDGLEREPVLGALVVGPPLSPAWERRARLTLTERLCARELPRLWRACEALPLTPTGKVDLRAASALLAEPALP